MVDNTVIALYTAGLLAWREFLNIRHQSGVPNNVAQLLPCFSTYLHMSVLLFYNKTKHLPGINHFLRLSPRSLV